jgi:hypothetical protein
VISDENDVEDLEYSLVSTCAAGDVFKLCFAEIMTCLN